jgi:hypothetical protein
VNTPLTGDQLDDTMWLQRRPCGCIVAAVAAVVDGRTLATAEQANDHFNPTPIDRGRAANARLTVVPVTGAEYRSRYQARWRCDEHARPTV